MPSGHIRPSGLGIYTRLTGCGRSAPVHSSSRNSVRKTVAPGPSNDVLTRHVIHPRSSVVSQHQPPRGHQHVVPTDPVIQRVKPELRFLLGLLTQLPSQLGDFRRQLDSGFHLRWNRRLILPRRLATFFRSGTFVQAVLLTSDENANLAGVLRSTGITPLPRYYGPLRLPTGPASGYVFPRAVEPSSGPEFGSPGRVSQVPRSICRHPPSSATPGSPAAALARCLAVGSRLRPFGKVGHSQLLGFNEAESGSLALRLTSSRSQASTGWLPITSLGSFMANEQLPWSVPFT